MVQMLNNSPGIVIYGNNVTKTSKVKKFVEKNKLQEFTVKYVENPSTDFNQLNKQLQELEDSIKGITRQVKPKEVFLPDSPKYEYRLNCNTVLQAYTKEQLDQLKKWYNV